MEHGDIGTKAESQRHRFSGTLLCTTRPNPSHAGFSEVLRGSPVRGRLHRVRDQTLLIATRFLAAAAFTEQTGTDSA
ncbi:hypothetical protein EYF80_063848 [Liparis tanakae]|uniref:Uncharacterized protein n=1 Tax=Liparis tanakae TaxID=230148 RepID=A0A4Z2EAV8_9TELE|nr:hypothetical protein EYF80_063848 [Liparis tanakae]